MEGMAVPKKRRSKNKIKIRRNRQSLKRQG